jgi:hypothetical protein
MCRYGDFVEGVVRGFDWGIARGFVLGDHPACRTKPQDTGDAGGSTGIPDSLDHKHAFTSGLPVWSGVEAISASIILWQLSPFPVVVGLAIQFPNLVIADIDLRYSQSMAIGSRAGADLRNLARSCLWGHLGNQSARRSEMAREECRERVLEKVG